MIKRRSQVDAARPLRPRTIRKCARLLIMTTMMAAVPTSDGGLGRASTTGVVGNISVKPAAPSRAITFRDRLITGLKARLESEIAFVDSVVLAVQTGRLPQRVVDQAYYWARNRAFDPRYGRPRRPIIYFQPAMIARVNRLGVEL